MNDSYVECLVKRETKPGMKVLKFLLIFLTVLVAFSAIVLFGNFLFYLIAVAFGVGAYFVSTHSDVEYEYLYVDRQISVDAIYAKSRRKNVGKYDVEKMEILAPIYSYKLDDFKNRNVKAADFSSGVESKPDNRYVFYYDGKEKIIIEPSAEFVDAVKNVAPRKVFTN